MPITYGHALIPALTVSSDTVTASSTITPSVVEVTAGIIRCVFIQIMLYVQLSMSVATSLRKAYSLVEIILIKTLIQDIDHAFPIIQQCRHGLSAAHLEMIHFSSQHYLSQWYQLGCNISNICSLIFKH